MDAKTRQANLLPNGTPKYVRCYDSGPEFADRFTAVFTGNYRKRTRGDFIHIGMSERPFHPQGVGQHGFSDTQIDTIKGSWGGPSIGRKHPALGKRITFAELPADCQKLVLSSYRELWNL